MFKYDLPDIVSICTPPETHARIVHDLCNQQIKAIWLEKPISDNLDDARGIVAHCRACGVTLQVNHQRRLAPEFIKLRQEIAEGKYGKTIFSDFRYNRGILNTGSHVFDILRYLFGDLSVGSIWKSDYQDMPQDPNLNGAVFFKNGTCTIMTDKDKQFELCVSGGLKTTYFPNDHRISLIPMLEDLIIAMELGTATVCSGNEALKSLETVMEFRRKFEASNHK